MTDQEKWKMAVARVTDEFVALPLHARKRVGELLDRLKRAKERVHAFADRLDAGEICAECGGECCATGKHHFTVVELLTYLKDGKQLVAPRFFSGLCPYLGDQGCLMEPAYRPFNCVTFNCERVDGLLEPSEREGFAAAEQELRSCYDEMDRFFDNRFLHGMLINCERDLLRHQVRILRGQAADGCEQHVQVSRRSENG